MEKHTGVTSRGLRWYYSVGLSEVFDQVDAKSFAKAR